MRKVSNNYGGPHTAQHSSHISINILFKPEEIWSLSGIERGSLLNGSQWKSHWQIQIFLCRYYRLIWIGDYVTFVTTFVPSLDSLSIFRFSLLQSMRFYHHIWIINNTLLCLAPTKFFLKSQTKNENERVISPSLGKYSCL